MKAMHPRKRLSRIINRASQAIRDGTYWNKINPKEPQLDLEPERVLLSLAKRAAALWDAGEIEAYSEASERMVAYAETMVKDEF